MYLCPVLCGAIYLILFGQAMDFYSPDKYISSTWKQCSVLLLPIGSQVSGKIPGYFCRRHAMILNKD